MRSKLSIYSWFWLKGLLRVEGNEVIVPTKGAGVKRLLGRFFLTSRHKRSQPLKLNVVVDAIHITLTQSIKFAS